MKLTKKERKILEQNFDLSEDEKDISLEAWTVGGVNMFVYISKDSNKTVQEQLENYVENFNVDEEIELYRKNKEYREAFSIRESLHDFDDWLKFVEGVIKELK